MRTEYTIVQKEKNGKEHHSTYPKSIVMEHYLKAKAFYETKGCTVELFKTQWVGNSLYRVEKIQEV